MELCGMEEQEIKMMAAPFIPASEEEVLSPESYVFVALMAADEGPNKAGGKVEVQLALV